MREELLNAARAGTTVTYGKLMKSHGLSRGKVLSRAIGDVDRLEYRDGGLGFAAIVVRKDTGFPGGGFFCDDELPHSLRRPRTRGSDPRLSAEETSYIKKAQRRIWAYYRRSKRNKPE